MPAVQGKIVYTGQGLIENATIEWEGATLTGVAESGDGDAKCYPAITPAIIDAHCHMGLIRGGEPGAEAEANDQMAAIIAHADVLDSIQMDDSGFASSIEQGVLYSCVLPGSGNILSGNSAVIRNYAANTNEALIARAGIKAAFGYNPMGTRDWKGTRPYTRMGALSMLRKALVDVRNKMTKEESQEDGEPVVYDAEEAVLKNLLAGEERLRVHVHKSDDVAALLRFVDEFSLDVTVEHTCDIHEKGTYDELARRGIPVVFGPMDCLAYKVELKHEHWSNIKHMIASGVEFGLMTDHPVILQRLLLLTLRWFLRAGLSKEQALQIITRKNAEILGIDDVLGTLEEQKWASFVCWSGDPFSLESYPLAVYAEGKLIYEAEEA